MIKKHEPNRYDDIVQVIEGIKTPTELTNFINHINDIESR